jgi:hypothetical protein
MTYEDICLSVRKQNGDMMVKGIDPTHIFMSKDILWTILGHPNSTYTLKNTLSGLVFYGMPVEECSDGLYLAIKADILKAQSYYADN